MPHPDPTDPAAPVPADHAAHDGVLVAAYAAGDADGSELETATALVAACADCADLHHDLRAIAAALPDLPAPARTRDFRLTPGQAASLRPAGWRRLLAPFAGPRFAFAAPLGSGLAALGVVGILLAGTGLPLGGATAGVAPAEAPKESPAEAERATSNGTGAAPMPAAAAPSPGDMVMAQGESAASGAPDASLDPQLALGPADQPSPGTGTSPGDAAARDAEDSTIPVALVVSLVGLAAGLVLVLLRFAGRSATRAH